MIYDYLDRPPAMLTGDDRFVLQAMRHWAQAVRTGRCACRVLATDFIDRGIVHRMSDFGIAMTTLVRDGSAPLYVAGGVDMRVTDDEARLLALFATARGGMAATRRMAAALVVNDAVVRLATAVAFVAAALVETAGVTQ